MLVFQFETQMLNHPVCGLSVGVVGVGVVGQAWIQKCVLHQCDVYAYDINEDTVHHVCETHQPRVHACTSVEDMCTKTSIRSIHVALPTQATTDGYDMEPFHTLLKTLERVHFLHPIYIMSTLLPTTLDTFYETYPTLQLFHIPEFLSSASAELDSLYPTQPFLLMGVPDKMSCAVSDRARVWIQTIVGKTQEVMVVKAKESASCKVFCNAFYAVKVQLCNEFYHICKKNNISYDIVRMLMLQNGWIHPMHTQVPGPDGSLSFGGKCLPKDLKALVHWTKDECPILKATL